MRTMGLKSVRSNNFGKQEPKKLGNVLVIACAILSLCILSLVKAHYFTAPYAKSNVDLKLEVPRTEDHSVDVEEPSIPVVPAEVEEEEEVITTNPICYESSERSDTCEARGDVRVQGSSRTIFVSPATTQEEWKIKPYARKNNAAPLAYTKEWSLKPFPAGGDVGREQIPQCTKNYTAPAVLFSIGGFTGNVFHDFTDVLIPLFITARRFKGEVHLLVSDTKPWWLNKYGLVLSQLSKYEFIETERSGNGDGDEEEDDNHNSIHCFPKIIAGPKFHKELGVDATKPPHHTMSEFKELLRSAFKLERARATRGGSGPLSEGGLRRPRLLIIGRRTSRAFVNERGMVAMAGSLGFDVRVGEAEVGTDAAKFARLVNSADVLVGVHGAGLTNMVFLPAGAVVVQVIPLGGLEYIARDSFGGPAAEMGVKYMEYVVGEEESTLTEEYGRDDPVIRDPASVHRRGWAALREVYLDKQNVRPHLGRLRDTLLEAIEHLPKDSS